MAVIAAGAAAALAKAELERRSAGKHKARGEKPRKRPRSKLQRKTLAQLDLAIELLEGRGEEPPEQTVHETRKALKRARALVRLQRGALGRKRFQRTNEALRKAGRRLAGARDAEVMVDALDRLVERHPSRLAHSPAIRDLRTCLVAKRERAAAHLQGGQTRALVLKELHATRRAVEHWQLPKDDRKTAHGGLKRIYSEGRQRHGQARKAATSKALHEWRKRVKDLRYTAEALGLRRVARQADRLGETLGEEHDLAVLAEEARLHRKCFKGEQTTRRALEKLIARRRQRLRRRAWRLGKDLYRRKPKRFVRRMLEA